MTFIHCNPDLLVKTIIEREIKSLYDQKHKIVCVPNPSDENVTLENVVSILKKGQMSLSNATIVIDIDKLLKIYGYSFLSSVVHSMETNHMEREQSLTDLLLSMTEFLDDGLIKSLVVLG